MNLYPDNCIKGGCGFAGRCNDGCPFKPFKKYVYPEQGDDGEAELDQNAIVEMIDNAIQKKQSEIQEQRLYDPKLEVEKWIRYPERLRFESPLLNMVSGPRGAGKSSLLEVLTAKEMKYGAKGILDVFSSRDSEGLAWCRHKHFNDDVLLIHGEGMKIACEFETMSVNEVDLNILLKHKLVVSVPKFYKSPYQEWDGLGRVLQILWDRDVWKKGDLRVLNLREGINMASSRLSLGGSQTDAKNIFIYALNQFRHGGITTNIDCLRLKSIDINVREIADYIWLKKQGIFGLPDDLNFLYRPYDLITDIMRVPTYGFILITIDGGIGHGSFQKPSWHKETDQSIYNDAGITDIQYVGDEAVPSKNNGTVGDVQHSAIIRKRLETDDKGKQTSMDKLATHFKISGRTVMRHIDFHNEDILNKGKCERCHRAKCELEAVNIIKTPYINR